MKVLVDGKLFEEKDGAETLESLLGRIQNSKTCADRIIVGVSLNGKRVENFDIEISGNDVVEVVTEDKKKVLKDIFDNFVERVDDGSIRELLRISADLFRTDRGTEAWERLDALWTLLRGVIMGVDSCTVEYSRDEAEVEEVKNKLKALNATMQELSESVESGDYVMVADSLEYELPERMEELKEVVAVMKRWLE